MSIYNEVLEITIYHLRETHSARVLHVLIQDFPYSMAHTVCITYGSLISLALVKYL